MENLDSSEDLNVKKAFDQLKSVLVAGETVESWAIQRRLFALLHRRIIIAATTGRFIIIKRGLIGGFDMNDFRWQDLGDVKLKVGIFGADILFRKFGSTDLAMNKFSSQIISLIGFRKQQTQDVYRLAQAQDQSWREKRRIRELEELRAKSGGLHLNSGNSNLQQPTSSSDDSVARLQKVKEMLDNKLISDSEYESIKAKIISGI